MDSFPDILNIINHPNMRELDDILSVALPEDLKTLFLKSNNLYIKNIPGSIYEVVKNRDRKNGSEYFYNLLHLGVQNSIAATYYNLNSFMYYCDTIKDKGSEVFKSINFKKTTTLALPAQKLIFEYEHFTLHSRVVLDRLNWFLNYYYLTGTRNLYRLYKDLSCRPKESDIPYEILKVIDKHRAFLDGLISTNKSKRRTERDELAHRKEIQFTTPNIIALPDGNIKVYLVCNDETLGDEADLVLQNRFNNLKSFIIEILNTFFSFN